MIGGDGINDESSKTSLASSHAQKQDAGGDEAHGGRGSRDSVVDRKLKTLVPNHPHMGFYLHAHDGLVPTTPDSSPRVYQENQQLTRTTIMAVADIEQSIT